MRISLVVGLLAFASLGCGLGAAGSPEDKESIGRQFVKELSQFGWSGTIVIKDEGQSETVEDNGVCCKTMTKLVVSNNVVLTVTKNAVAAKVTFASKSRADHVQRYEYHKVVGYTTNETTANGTDQSDSRFTVDMRPDGRYRIQYKGGGVKGEYRMFDTAETICTGGDPSCRPGTNSTQDSGQPPNQGVVEGTVEGQVDPKQLKSLVGMSTESLDDASANYTGTRTVTWNLSR
jgi:hypothetical protein